MEGLCRAEQLAWSTRPPTLLLPSSAVVFFKGISPLYGSG